MVVDPWGKVLVDAGEALGLSYADIDQKYLKSVRKELPMGVPEEAPGVG